MKEYFLTQFEIFLKRLESLDTTESIPNNSYHKFHLELEGQLKNLALFNSDFTKDLTFVSKLEYSYTDEAGSHHVVYEDSKVLLQSVYGRITSIIERLKI